MLRNCSNGICPNKNPQPISNFHKSKKTKHGCQSRCKDCRSREATESSVQNVLRAVTWAKNNPADCKKHQKNYRLKSQYGISLSEYDRLLSQQGMRCSICRTKHGESASTVLVVDHNHKTGSVRSLLCRQCNSLIGFSRENKEILKNTIKYLVTHG